MKKCFLIFSLTIPTLPIQPTQQPTNLTPSEHIIYQLVDTAYWVMATTSVSLGLQKAIVLYNETAALQRELCFDPNQQVVDFITTELQTITTQDITIKIHPNLSYECPAVSLKKHILIAQSSADEISNALETNDETTLDKWRAILHHEIAHVQNNDILWRAATDIATPFVLHGIGSALYYALSLDKQDDPFAVQQLLKLNAGIGIWSYGTLIRMAFYKYQEQRADNTIHNNPNLLKGMRSFLNDIETITRNNLKHLTDKQYKWNRWLNNLAEEHPLNEKRIAKLDQRIATIE
jgi:hypothetical protein